MLRLHLYGQDAAVANEEAFLRHAVRNLSATSIVAIAQTCVGRFPSMIQCP